MCIHCRGDETSCVGETNALRADESIKVDFLDRLVILIGLAYDPIRINRILFTGVFKMQLATRIYWTVGIGVGLLTLVLGTVPYLLRVLFFLSSP